MLPKAEELAYGRWPEILKAAGVDSSFLNGKNGPCPFCPDAGRDRFRFQDKNGGRWVCAQCTESQWSGGFQFLMKHMGYHSFNEAADHVRDFFGIKAGADDENTKRVIERLKRQPVRRDSEIDVQAGVERMQRLWNESRVITCGDPVDRYLRRRVPSLGLIPGDIHYHPQLGYWEAPETLNGKPVFIGNFPAMVVRGLDAAGNLVQIHKTYLTPEGQKAPVDHAKKTDRGIGANSFALRLGVPTGDTLAVCEGIETALAAWQMDETVPVWPCHCSSVLANFQMPVELQGQIRRVIIYADADELKNGRRAGSEAAAKLASNLRQERIRSLIVRPAKTGKDFADLAVETA
jgi:putative DNA primase/helicase